MSNKLAYLLLLGIAVSIFSCTPDDDEGGPTDPNDPEEAKCVLQKVYYFDQLNIAYEYPNSTTIRRNYYAADTITSSDTYLTDTDGRIISRTRTSSQSTYSIEYSYNETNTFPDTAKFYILNSVIPELSDYSVLSYQDDDCNISLVQSYDPNGELLGYVEYTYEDENCNFERKYYQITDGSTELISHYREVYDSEQNPNLPIRVYYGSPHNLTQVSDILSGNSDIFTASYEYNEYGYPISSIEIWNYNGSSTESHYTFEYICD